jgi:hypothetical protein
MRKKQSKGKAYLKGKKLLKGEFLDFQLIALADEKTLGIEKYDTILIEEIPGTVSNAVFWEDLIHLCRVALKPKGKIYAILPRKGKMLPFEILRENEEITIYSIDK